VNRAFYIVISPPILVACVYLAMNYGHVVPRWLAFSVAGVSVALAAGHFARRKFRRPS